MMNVFYAVILAAIIAAGLTFGYALYTASQEHALAPQTEGSIKHPRAHRRPIEPAKPLCIVPLCGAGLVN